MSYKTPINVERRKKTPAAVDVSFTLSNMLIKEYGFKANLMCDMQKFTFDYKQHWGLEVSCTIVPVVTLSDSAQ